MPFFSHRVPVQADMDRLWSLLVDKIRHPEKYVPGVEQVRILKELGPLSVERLMHVRSPAGLKPIHELIVADTSTRSVLFKLLDDPVYSGWVLNVVYEESGRLELEYALYWSVREGVQPAAAPDLKAAIEGAVEHTRALAENRG